MDTLTDLPTHGQFVSAALLADGVLTVRLKPESIVEADAAAYVLHAYNPIDSQNTLRAVEEVRKAGEYVYAYVQEGAVVLSGEGGEELVIRAARFAGERAELNATELKDALVFTISLYKNAHEAGRRVELTLQRVRELLYEQARRVAVKAEGRESASTVGVLYAQHAQFIERLLRETDV